MKIFIPTTMTVLNLNINEDLVLTDLFASVRKDTDGGNLDIRGGDDTDYSGGYIRLFGATEGMYPGRVQICVPNAARNADIIVMEVTGVTDTPVIDCQTHRVTNVAVPTTNGDALSHQAWATWTPTLTWGTGTPAGLTIVARWTQIGKVVFFEFYCTSNDGNAASSLTITLPVAHANNGANINYRALQRVDATYYEPRAYSNPNSNLISFLAFQPCTDTKLCQMWVSGTYEVA